MSEKFGDSSSVSNETKHTMRQEQDDIERNSLETQSQRRMEEKLKGAAPEKIQYYQSALAIIETADKFKSTLADIVKFVADEKGAAKILQDIENMTQYNWTDLDNGESHHIKQRNAALERLDFYPPS